MLLSPHFYLRAFLDFPWPSALMAFFLGGVLGYLGFRRLSWGRGAQLKSSLKAFNQVLRELDLDQEMGAALEEVKHPQLKATREELKALVQRMKARYRANQQFTQNAAHELQTPLAIIKGNLELLLQSKQLGEWEIAVLETLMQNARRLARINSALILLSKIENRHFSEQEAVKLAAVTDEILHNFQDLIEIRGLSVKRNYEHPATIHMNETLAEILIANLVQNAIRHNTERGFIEIHLKGNRLRIINSGPVLQSAAGELFQRFRRESSAEESLGLGLSIVKSIAERYGFEVAYSHRAGNHELRVVFGHS